MNNVKNWLENIKFDSLNSDPYLIKIYKSIRKSVYKYKNLIRTIFILTLLSFIFTYSGVEDQISNNKIYKSLLIFLNIITFIGIFFPISIKPSLTESNVIEISEKREKEKEDIRKIQERCTF